MNLHHSALLKSWQNTKLARNLSSLWSQPVYRRLGLFTFFLIFWLACSYVFYLRFPNNYHQPNFFGEDGSIFARNIMAKGFLGALGTTFNGYYIWAIYILEKLGFMINAIFYNGEFVNLPRSLALVSYGFFGLVATLPILLFRNYLKLPALILATLFVLFVPLGGWDYGILGTIGNTKFAVVFVAFLLLAYRNYMPSNSRKVYLIDIGLLICAYTNVTVYVMMPFALVRYWPDLWSKQWFSSIKRLLRQDRSAQSLVLLGIALLPQLYVVKRYGVPTLPGYLDTPYESSDTVEIFGARSYLYGLFFWFYKSLSDLAVVAAFLAILVLMWKFARKYLGLVSLGLFTVFASTFLFTIKRTGLSTFFNSYQDAGPAQFFFASNWVFGFLLAILIVEIIGRIKDVRIRTGTYAAIGVLFIVVLIPRAGSYGKNNFMEKTVGNIYAVAQESCRQNDAQTFSVTSYPSKAQQFPDVTRSQLCTPAAINYHPTDLNLGLLPEGNTYIDSLGSTNQFLQGFVSPYNGLDGLSIYFSTFLETPKSPYNLNLLEQDCKTKILTTPIKTSEISDNSFYTIKFPAIKDSAGKAYCFDIESAGSPVDPLAVQLSADNLYTEGGTTINNQSSTKDIVFGLHYK
jgi:hypothetical protein